MHFIDTHTHLYDEAFAGEEDLAVARAVEAGVTKMVLPDIDSQTRQAMLSLADRHQGTLFPCIGLHPTSVDAGWQNEMLEVEKHLDRKIYAIGEIGMDCYWSKEFISEQEEVLRIQLETAARMSLPVIIHSRESTELIINILKDCSHLGLRGVFHAFSGSYETYSRIASYGNFMVGIGGGVTYKNAGVAKSVEKIPLDRIVLETDSPYLTPVPFRGKRNESSYLVHIAGKIAEIKGCTLEEVAAATTANAYKMFGL